MRSVISGTHLLVVYFDALRFWQDSVPEYHVKLEPFLFTNAGR